MRVVPAAWWYAGPLVALAVVSFIVAPFLSMLLGAVALGVLGFFRDPSRSAPNHGIVSPADGRISVIRREGDRIRVGVYMNILNVHVNRAPTTGTVRQVEHRSGAHRPAFSKDSERNERVVMELVTDDDTVGIELIAGTIARRIHPYVAADDAVSRGDRIGHIAFGSRADVVLPPQYSIEDILVEEGERVRGGETIVAISHGGEHSP